MSDWIREKQIYYLNSGNQLSSNSNTFTASIKLNDRNRYNRITVLQVAIPISYWLVEAGLNTFTLVEGTVSSIVSVPPGNYNQQSFADVVSSLLTSSSAFGTTYTITFQTGFTTQQTGLFTFTANTIARTIKFVFNSANSLNEQFGFDIGQTVVFTVSGPNSVLTSQNTCQFIPENTLFLHSPICNDENGDILQEIYNQSNPPFSYISWLNPCPFEYSKPIKNRNVDNITISIMNENNVPIYFNGCNVTITIMMYRDNWDFYNMLSNYISFKIRSEHERIMAATPEPEIEEEKKVEEDLVPETGAENI